MTRPLSADALRWRCPPDLLPFETTEDLDPVEGVVGQERAVEALSFGLAFRAPKQHVFVRGQEGTGRLTLVRRLLADPGLLGEAAVDRVYVVDFTALDRPALLELPPGRAGGFKTAVGELATWIKKELIAEVQAVVAQQRHPLDKAAQTEVERVSEPFEAALAESGLELVQIKDEDGDLETAILPTLNGEPVTLEQLAAAVSEGLVTAEVALAAEEAIEQHSTALTELSVAMSAVERHHQEAVNGLVKVHGRQLIEGQTKPLRKRFPMAAEFFSQIVDHCLDNLGPLQADPDEFVQRFEVNVLMTRSPAQPRPVIVESAPSVIGLLGSIDMSSSESSPPHMGIRSGSFIRADGGFLVLDARELVRQEGAWESLARVLRTGEIQLLPDDQPTTLRPPGIKPAPVPIDVKVVLMGDDEIYYLLDQGDPDFPNLFKILADFDATIAASAASIGFYATVVTGVAERSCLPPFTRDAVAALVEQGARIASEQGRLTARFGRVADLARESAWLTEAAQVTREDVDEAIRRAARRGDGPGTAFRERIQSGAVRILTDGTSIGEINGLAVMVSGQQAFGMPTRITASVGPGRGGAVNIEHEASLSGQIHVKSFHILQGLLRRTVAAEHPLVFDASIAFEQSYGGIDGDSASAASFCALLSALTGMPVRQDLAMTGAIDQVGNVLPIGAVNEKIEGFFDVVRLRGLQSGHGVIIPTANAGDLMLRIDVVEAEFPVYPVARIEDAVTLFFGTDAESVYVRARERLRQYWEVSDRRN